MNQNPNSPNGGADASSQKPSESKGLADEQPLFLGHPTGLYTLFFAEMWERFSYYGMRALLVLYLIKGFMGMGDKDANAVYGAYTALLYMTPFFGGMIADKLIGARSSVIIGGLFMAAGHLLMIIQIELWFFTALGLLIVGNGFFKPNISTIVGTLYPAGSPKRDGGFTIFYIGINLGAAMAPLLCGFVGETYGWHWGFGLATAGMMVGLAVFVAPTLLTQAMIGLTAVLSVVSLLFFNAGDVYSLALNIFVAIGLLLSGLAALIALQKGGLPKNAGAAPNPKRFQFNMVVVLIGTVLLLPIFVLLVSGFAVVPGIDKGMTLIPESVIEPLAESESKLVKGLSEFVSEASRPAGLVLITAGLIASIYLLKQAFSLSKVGRERMFVVFILTFFSLLFWSFFEQSGSSVNNFTDRNIDRVIETSMLEEKDVGTTEELRLTVDKPHESLQDLEFLSQEYLGHENANKSMNTLIEKAIAWTNEEKEESKQSSEEELKKTTTEVLGQKHLTMTALTYLREYAKRDDAKPEDQKIQWEYVKESVGGIGRGGAEIPASVFQSVNPVFIMVFGLIFSALWSFLGARGFEPSTPIKFALGLIQLAFGFAMLYFGAQYCDGNGMVAAFWLVLMYLLLTTGELCLSPVGLSMITKLSPARLVSTVMGAWFLATAFSQFLAAIIAQFAAVPEAAVVPIPNETVNLYGGVYGMIALMAGLSGLFCLVMSPVLSKWMHVGVEEKEMI